ncbi:hypothetical protein G5714_004366 [Onychostoma macrolepis]|uniref:Ubiquitin-like protease family profile domain-containing protein n=1 Tax=Onychostoma macrolepis TaxID=369639 RepID=A0A7J6D4H7_9TELE|nr:hypothetical protein G5714_004366 [Onychostoma macrolepis]
MSNYSYKKVNFENYDAIIGFMQVHSNHWKFLYLNRTLQKAFVVDPQGNDEEKDSALAAKRFRQYFKMRQIVHNKTDWVDVKWTTGVLTHNIQKDGYSCGIYVMQMAKETVEAFPMIPSEIIIPSNKHLLSELRKEMAVTILESSGSESHLEKGNLHLSSQAEVNQGLITAEGHLEDLLATPQRQVPDGDLSVGTPCHPEYLQLQVDNGPPPLAD